MIDNFKLQGIASGAIRSDEDMLAIDKETADNTFKEQKKKLDSFLRNCGDC